MRIVFIGGTGRSGTTVLAKVLSGHSRMMAFDFETRLLIDPDGLLTLIRTWENNWSPYTASKALSRFRQMTLELSRPIGLRYRIINKVLSKLGCSYQRYRQVPFHSAIQPNEFVQQTDKFINRLSKGSYQGVWYGTESFVSNPKVYVTEPIPKEEVVSSVRSYIDSLISPVLQSNNKEIWVEHTPFNVLHTEELLSVFPEAKFIHMKRDIRDVISSYKGKDWGAKNLDYLISWMKGYFDKWERSRNKISKSSVKEIWLEDMVNSPNDTLKEIFDFIGVEDESDKLRLDLSLSNQGRWKDEMTPDEVDQVEGRLNKYLYK
ncbi:sulfotransferase family protein [Marinoscillum furvescens]|uniref:Sulfotransferase family protein n=1 Tax=Marinoscillum furvescens DSM 4134 TaxID=1122208 RepID=A0A3D9L5I3_MARFU|nr:sulfotransferase [Marinoscillum furvescens]RED99555.1 sulfotransferase family protein [Marinoscillum furvescens DSM 4134]